MTTRIAALLKVVPSPATLSESNAIYKALVSRLKTRVLAFTKRPSMVTTNAVFYDALLQAKHDIKPPSDIESFDVIANNDQLSLEDEDPFNIRGLQDRKPYPIARTFKCSLKYIPKRSTLKSGHIEPQHIPRNAYEEPYLTHTRGLIATLYDDLGTPSILQAALAEPVTKADLESNYQGSVDSFLKQHAPTPDAADTAENAKLLINTPLEQRRGISLDGLQRWTITETPDLAPPRVIDGDEAEDILLDEPEFMFGDSDSSVPTTSDYKVKTIYYAQDPAAVKIRLIRKPISPFRKSKPQLGLQAGTRQD